MEEVINIKKTQLSPKVLLNKKNKNFILYGKSGVENAEDFYNPIINWFENYFNNPNEKTEIYLYLEYLNSSSSVQIGKLLNIISNYQDNLHITINWLYDSDDELMKETGKEFQYMYDLKFNFIEKDEDAEYFNF